MSELTFADLSVSYDDRIAVHPLTLQVPSGGWLCLIGPNGAGKSSVLRSACGLVEHSGSVTVAGVVLPFCGEVLAEIRDRGPLGVSEIGTGSVPQRMWAKPAITVIGVDILEADRFATAAFAMGRDGILFVEQTPGLEGYAVDRTGRATLTSGFGDFCLS